MTSKEVGLSFLVTNPGAIANNHTAMRQLAKWLVDFGIAQGTIKLRKEAGTDGAQGKKVLRMRRRFDEEELRANMG